MIELTFTHSDGTRWRASQIPPQDRDHAEGMVWWFDGPNEAQKRFAADSAIGDAPAIEQLRAIFAAAKLVD